MAKGKFLAVAYTDVNGNDNFDGKDTLIAGLIDTNKDKVVSVGDTVTFGTYPRLSGNEAGTFLSNDTIITTVFEASDGVVHVGVPDGSVFWTHFDGAGEVFGTSKPGLDESLFSDDFTAVFPDRVFADSDVDGPGDPETGIAMDTVFRSGDQDFLDVFIA